MDQAALVLRRGLPEDALPTRLSGIRTPDAPHGLIVVSDQQANQALSEWLASANLPRAGVAITTIEGLAKDLLAARDRPAEMLSRAALLDVVRRWLRQHGRNDSAENVTDDLEEYLRASDAGADHDALVDLLERLDEWPFDRSVTAMQLSKLAALATVVENVTPDERHPSRSHLVHHARASVDEGWDGLYPSVEWVSFVGLSRLDNPTLRLVCQLSVSKSVPAVEFYVGPGTADTFAARFKSAAARCGFAFADPDDEVHPKWLATIYKAARGDHTGVPDLEGCPLDIGWLTLPDERREAGYVVHRAVEREASGRSAGEILAVAPDAGAYRVDLVDFAHRCNVPVSVETRRKLAYEPAARAITSLLLLLSASDAHPVTYERMVEPLTMGLQCDPGSGQVSDDILTQLKVDLPAADDVEPKPVIAWLPALRRSSDSRVVRFADTVNALRQQGCSERAVQQLSAMTAALGSSPWVSLDSAAGLTPGSADGDRQTIHRELEPVDTITSRVVEALTSTYQLASDRGFGDWARFTTAFLTGTASAGGSHRFNDADAVQAIDAGNALFRRSPEVIILGLAEERFPVGGEPSERFPTRYRDVVRTGANPFLFLDTPTAMVERSLDGFAAAVTCATERVTLVRPGRDGENRPLRKSRFTRGLSPSDPPRVSTNRHPVDGFAVDGDPSWVSRIPDTYGERLRTVALYSGTSTAGQQWPAEAAGVDQFDSRLVAIAGTLPEGLATRATAATGQFEAVVNEFQAARADFDRETMIDLPTTAAPTDPTQPIVEALLADDAIWAPPSASGAD